MHGAAPMLRNKHHSEDNAAADYASCSGRVICDLIDTYTDIIVLYGACYTEAKADLNHWF
jgi:hypothetical protein